MTQIVGAPAQPTGTTTSYTYKVPTGVTANMVGLVAFATPTPASILPVTFSAAGGTFTQLDARTVNNSFVTLVKTKGLTAGQTVTITIGVSQIIYVVHFYQDQYDIVSTPFGAAIRSASTTTSNSGSLTPAVGSTVLLVAVERTLNDNTIITSVASSGGETISQIGYSETTVNPDISVYFGQFVATSATAHTATLNYSDASSNGYAALFSTTPLAVTPIVPAAASPKVHYVAANGALANTSVFYVSAPGVTSAAKEMRPMQPGYPSVANMLAQYPFYVAHRGGSSDWPEMSLYGYTQSVYWGAGALEVSLNRTSDGVWVGCHDATLDRTSGTSGFTISAHTWAEVQAYQITAAATNNPYQPKRPYMRWEELIATYYQTHVIFVDPKNATAYASELLNMMDACPGTPTDRFVAKYYGVVNGWPQSASARGYKGWGYFYQADVPNLVAYQGRWDILGMDYTANQASWTAVLSYGKPVIGHIAPTAAAVNTALNYGAKGVMVSGVQEGIPRH